MAKALVLGGEQPTSIGTKIAQYLPLASKGEWSTCQDDCRQFGGSYEVPEMHGDEDALIITLGRTSVDEFTQAPEPDIEDTIRACLTLPLLAAKEYLTVRERQGGCVVFIGSYAYNHPISYGTVYCAAKAGLAQATKTLAWDYSDKGYTFHIVHPYHTPGTPMWEQVQERVMETRNWTREQADEYARLNLKQPGMLTPMDIAEVIWSVLRTPARGWLSGAGLELYGGTR